MSHLTVADYLAHRVEGTPLPCSCPACADAVRRWEADRALASGAAGSLQPSFWTAQEARLEATLLRRSPVRPWLLAGAAALLVLGAGLGLVLKRDRVPAADDFEARYAAVQEALDRSAIGDLEACGVLLNETEENSSTTEEAI